MANELDELMDKDPLEMTQDDISAIVAYHRRQRLRLSEAGAKAEAVGRTSIDLKALGLIKTPEASGFKRRI